MLKAKETAVKLYTDAYMRWSYELSEEKNRATAKNAAEYVCDKIIQALADALDEEILIPHILFWAKVKEEIKNL